MGIGVLLRPSTFVYPGNRQGQRAHPRDCQSRPLGLARLGVGRTSAGRGKHLVRPARHWQDPDWRGMLRYTFLRGSIWATVMASGKRRWFRGRRPTWPRTWDAVTVASGIELSVVVVAAAHPIGWIVGGAVVGGAAIAGKLFDVRIGSR